ncbi:MAG TPA: hypothetical protein VGM44_00045 [Polyangiaceae bacterium]
MAGAGLAVTLAAAVGLGGVLAADAAESETASGRALDAAAAGARASAFNGRIGKALPDATVGGAAVGVFGEPISATKAPNAPPIAIAI